MIKRKKGRSTDEENIRKVKLNVVSKQVMIKLRGHVKNKNNEIIRDILVRNRSTRRMEKTLAGRSI